MRQKFNTLKYFIQFSTIGIRILNRKCAHYFPWHECDPLFGPQYKNNFTSKNKVSSFLCRYVLFTDCSTTF